MAEAIAGGNGQGSPNQRRLPLPAPAACSGFVNPIAPEQLGSVLGQDTVASMAGQMGLNSQDLLGQLSQLLPQVVDQLTPDGQLPTAQGGGAGLGELAGMRGGLLKR